MDHISGGVSSSIKGVATNTITKQSGAFKKWINYLNTGHIHDIFLDNFSTSKSNMLLVGFANYVRNNTDGPTKKNQLTHGAVSSAISNVVSTFRQNLRPDPTLDLQGKRNFHLQRLLKGYKDEDPAVKSQACLPLAVFEHMVKQSTLSTFDNAISQLIIGALFFAMRSCEYSTVNGDRKTKQLNVGNI